MTTPLPVLPQIIAEAGLLPAAPGQGGTTLFLDSAASGKQDTNTQGAGTAWTDISPYVLGFTVTRPSTRLAGPLWNYQAGTASITLDNSDGRFDPDNLAGPYVTAALPATRVGATLNNAAMGAADFNAAQAKWQTLTGQSISVTRVYKGVSVFTYDTNMQEMVAAGVKICLDLRPAFNPVSSADLASMTTLLTTLRAAGANVNVSLWAEPFFNGLTVAQFQAVMQYYGPVVRQYYPLAFCSAAYSMAFDGETAYYPGDALVDIIATDMYASHYAAGVTLDQANPSPSKPFGIWEISTSTDPVNGQTQAQAQAFISYVQSWMSGRQADGQPTGDVIWFNSGTWNLLTPAFRSTFEGSGTLSTYYTGTNATLATTTAQANTGTTSMSLTAAAAGSMSAHTPSAQQFPVTVGTSYRISAWFMAASVARSCQPQINFRATAGGTIVSTISATSVPDTTTGWTQVSVTGTVPPGATFAEPVFQVLSAAASEVHYVDDPVFATSNAQVTMIGTDSGAGTDYRVAEYQSLVTALDGKGAIPAVTELNAMVPVRVRANFGTSAYPLYSGFADGWMPAQVTYEGGYAELTLPATDAFKVLAGITLPQLGSPEGAGADTGARVADILARAGWYTSGDRKVISTGNSLLQGTTLGDTALNLMQVAADSEIGQLYVNGAGAVVFRARRDLLTDLRSNSPRATFGDVPDGPGAPLNANTGFEAGVSPWTGHNGTITSSGAQAHSGSLSALLTPAGGFTQAWIESEMIPVVAGADYRLTGWAYSPAGWASGISVNINWFDSSGAYQSTSASASVPLTGVVPLPAATWTQFTFAARAPLTGFMSLAPTVIGSPPATALTYFDDVTVIRASTELAYAAVTRTSDDTTIANDVQATAAGGALQEVQDAASIAKYLFPRSYARSDLILQDDIATLNWAQWVLYVGKDGEDRFESLAVDPQADPVNLWPQVLGREIGDRITIIQRPAGFATAVRKDCFITGITHTWDSVTSAWLTTWTLQDASKYGSFFVLDDFTLGALDSNALAF